MKKSGLFLFIFLLPGTLFGYDYFVAMNCTGLTGTSGSTDNGRLSACVNDLINGINETRRTVDAKNNQTQDRIGKVDSSVELMQRTVRNRVNGSDQPNKKDSGQEGNSELTRIEKEIEKNNKETDLKIEQLEKRINTLETLLSNFTDGAGSSKPKADK